MANESDSSRHLVWSGASVAVSMTCVAFLFSWHTQHVHEGAELKVDHARDMQLFQSQFDKDRIEMRVEMRQIQTDIKEILQKLPPK